MRNKQGTITAKQPTHFFSLEAFMDPHLRFFEKISSLFVPLAYRKRLGGL